MGLTNAFPAGLDLTDALLNAAVPLGARYEQRSAQPAIVSAVDTKARFETSVHTNSDVVPSGTGNTDFALQRVGLWLVTVAMRYLGNAGGGERHIFPQTGTTFNVSNRIDQDAKTNVGSAPVTVTCATAFRITTAPTTIIVGLFQNSTNNITVDVGFGGTNHISLTWLGPV